MLPLSNNCWENSNNVPDDAGRGPIGDVEVPSAGSAGRRWRNFFPHASQNGVFQKICSDPTSGKLWKYSRGYLKEGSNNYAKGISENSLILELWIFQVSSDSPIRNDFIKFNQVNNNFRQTSAIEENFRLDMVPQISQMPVSYEEIAKASLHMSVGLSGWHDRFSFSQPRFEKWGSR